MAKKILVVDDEIDFLKMIKIRLESGGFSVITATNGREALEKVKAENPDAVFLDILMPGMDGLQVLRKIRRLSKDLPVYIITAFSNEERFKMAEKLNASGFVAKTSDLSKEIERIFSASRLSGQYKPGKKRRS